jgi:hypothetical protein
MRIEGLRKYQRRGRGGLFADLNWKERQRAREWLAFFCRRWRGNLTRPRYALLCGQARRLARTTPEERSRWGRSMLSKRGGLAVQRRYRLEGRHPTAIATDCRVRQQAAVRRTRQPGFRRTWTGNLDGI